MNANRCLAWSLALLLTAPTALAQETNPYNGVWRASLESARGTLVAGTVTVKDQGGGWDMISQSRTNPCTGRAYPITVQTATAEEFAFSIDRAKTLAGCKDGKVSVKRLNDKTLEGTFEGNRKITLTRE